MSRQLSIFFISFLFHSDWMDAKKKQDEDEDEEVRSAS